MMPAIIGKRRINPTSCQYNRWLCALDPDYAKIDERSFNQLLDFSVQFGSLINFFNLEDKVDGDWVDFFQAHPGVVFASIEAIKIADIEKHFNQLQKQAGRSSTLTMRESSREGIELITRLASRFDAWMVALDNNDKKPAASVILRDHLRLLIEKSLSEHLQQLQLLAYKHRTNSGDNRATGSAETEFPRFSAVWKLNRTLSEANASDYFTETSTDNRFDQLLVILHAFIDGLADLQHYVRFNMPDQEDYSRHRPHIALYKAFAKIYRHAQQSVNTFSSRYARFYYEDVLRAHQRPALSDQVYLNFTLEQDDKIVSALVPGTTLFSAGQDDNGNDIMYSADKSLQVSTAAITRLRMVNVERGPLISNSNTAQKITPENSLVVKRLLSNEIPLDENGQGGAPWPMFGSTPSAELATLGFAISSPYLLLSGGERRVKLQLQYSQHYHDEILHPLLLQLSNATGRSKSEIFRQVLGEAFMLYASSPSEWFKIEDYYIEFTCDDEKKTSEIVNENIFLDRIFKICFNLPASAPALEPLLDPTAGNFHFINAGQPMVNTYLSQQAITIKAVEGDSVEVYPISLLDKMALDAVNIFTDVKNLNNLVLHNTDGEIDPSSPFLVFGGTPVVGSYLQISHRELFVKTPTRLDVILEWFNIPQNDNGFSGYYRYYDIGPNGTIEPGLFNNTTFLGEINIVNPGCWYIGDSQAKSPKLSERVSLFRTKPVHEGSCNYSPPVDGEPLCSYTHFQQLAVQTLEQGYPPYYNPIDSALRLMLSAPSYAFGNTLYPQNVLNAVIEDLPNTNACKEKCLCDCRPFEDTILCLKSILNSCFAIADPDKKPQSISIKLAESELTLINAFIQCLLHCPSDYKNGVDVQETLKKINDLCNELLLQPPATGLDNIKKCLDTVDALKTNTTSSREACEGNCEAIYQVVTVLFELMNEEQGSEWEKKVKDCLVSSLGQVQEIYETRLTACMNDCMTIKQELKYPAEPYLPQLVSVAVNYQASCTLFDTTGNTTVGVNCGFYHLLPFSGYRQQGCYSRVPLPMLPNYVNDGNLYIGMSELVTPQLLTLLFQMSGGCGLELPRVQWDSLSNNKWQMLPPIDDLSDSTYGLQNSGIVSLDVPLLNNTGNTILASDYSWLRASVAERAEQFPLTQGIFPHALLANRVINEHARESPTTNEADHTITSNEKNSAAPSNVELPAHTISASVIDLPGISQINQPMSSFGGRAPESYPEFEVRIGERLRHKDRAIQTWDYERIVLEQFPDIWKVQALGAHDLLHSNAPGNVLVVVIAGPQCIDCVDPTTPNVPNEMLQRIRQTLQERTSPFVQLHVSNPVYLRVQVQVRVSFFSEEDPGANIARLNNDLVQYLSPWFYDIARSTRDGDYALEADIASFILNRHYVREMESIQYFYEPKPEALESDWYFLTSAIRHKIDINNDNASNNKNSGHQIYPVTESGCSY